MAFLDAVFNPVLLPLVDLNPFVAILVVSLLVSVITVLVYKLLTNQQEMKRLKDEQKEYQKKFKELKQNPEEMMKLQKEAMKKNMEYMKHSLKPMLITFIPLILIFGWMNAHMAFEQIYPGEPYGVTAVLREGVSGTAQLLVDNSTELVSPAEQPAAPEVTWNLKSAEGEHFLTVQLGNDQQTKKVLITKELRYEPSVSFYEHSDIEQIHINYNKLRPAGKLSLFSWQPGWLAWYIFFSLVFSIGLRKVLKVY